MSGKSSIVYVEASALAPGSLYELFSRGAIAVVVNHAPDLGQLWTGLLENESERLPWNGTMRDMAGNHYAGKDLGGHVGDMFHYTPNRIAYIARKFELKCDASTRQVKTIPEQFMQDNQPFTSPPEIIGACWTLASTVMEWLTPPDHAHTPYQAVVHRLKYEADFDFVERYFALTRSAVGRWAQLGYWIDGMREEARGPLFHDGVSDIFAVLSLLRPMRRALTRLNGSFARRDMRNAIPQGTHLIGKAHYDGRYFSAMCGARGNICTEAFDGEKWVELPIDREHLVVIPGLDAQRAFGVRPTLHRILHRSGQPTAPSNNFSAPDITLLFGAK